MFDYKAGIAGKLAKNAGQGGFCFPVIVRSNLETILGDKADYIQHVLKML